MSKVMKEKMLSLCFSPSCSIPISLVSFVCGVSWFFKFAAHSKRFCLCFYFSPLFSVVDSSRQCPAEVIVSTAAASSSFLLLKNHMVVNLKYWLRWIFFFNIFYWMSFFFRFYTFWDCVSFPSSSFGCIVLRICNPIRKKCELQ